jgi:glutaryl-CoA dehydrogenase|tara:strand:- start:2597 stop:3745 length:1149 start_codon:yes stop_codon:yes gene_type:complete
MERINILVKRLNLTTTENIVLHSVKNFSKHHLSEYLTRPVTTDNIRKIYQEFGDIGIFGSTITSDYTAGLTNKMYGLIAKEIEAVDSGFRSMLSVQSSLVMKPIHQYGGDRLFEKYVPDLSIGKTIGCFGLTEPDSGSDASAMKTNARLDGNHYILNGSKTWITSSPLADVFIIWAKEDGKVSGFVLDRSMEGISTPEIKNKMSLKSSITGMIHLTDVKVPKENKLDVSGMRGPLSCLNNARFGISFGVLGAAEYCIQQTIDYGLNRNLFGSLLAEKQLFQSKLANMTTEYNLGLSAALTVADNMDDGVFIPEMISLIKRNNCSKSLNIAREARDMLGGNGITEEYNIFRHMVNLETVNTYEGTHDIHSLILGNYVTERKAF